MKAIRQTAVLVYYDGVQVFEARDEIGGHYVATLVSMEDNFDRYTVVGVAPESLRAFRAGSVDLRTLIEKRADPMWYLVDVRNGFDEPMALTLQPEIQIPEMFLPDAGFTLFELPIQKEDEVLVEARMRNNMVLSLALEPPEAAAEHRIRATTLSEALFFFQTLLRRAYGNAIRALSPKVRSALDTADAYLLDVVIPAAPGSFRVVFEAAKPLDLLGHHEAMRALEKLDELMATPGDPEKTLERLRENQGHLAGAFLRFIQFLHTAKTGVRYEWALPQATFSRRRSISQAETGPLINVLSKASQLAIEKITLLGPLRKVDIDAGLWRLGAHGEQEEHSGRVVAGGPSLSNLITDKWYRFECDEIVEEVAGTGKERRTLYLREYQEIGALS